MNSLELAVLCLVGGVLQTTPPPSIFHWPLVPESVLAVNGVESGTAQVQSIFVGIPSDMPKNTKPISETDPTSRVLRMPVGSPVLKSVQIAFMTTSDGILAKLGGFSLVIRTGHIWFSKDAANPLDIAPLRQDGVNDIQLVKHYDSLIAYVNGKPATQTITPTAPLLPLQIGFDSWKGSVIGFCGYTKVLSEDEVVANQRAGIALAKALFADTKTVTVDAELGALTPVPELDRIAPYRSALVAEEYTITRVTSGRMSALKPGMKIRIFRWGLLAGKKTDVANAKSGDHAQMVIQPLSSDPKFEKEFQVDNLDGDISALYFVDVTPSKG